MYKLDRKTLTIIGLLEQDPELTSALLAKQLHMKTSNVAYKIRQLYEDGLLTCNVMINPWALKLLPIATFFSIRATNSQASSKLINAINNLEGLSWLGTLAGEFHFGLTYYAKNFDDFVHKLSKVIETSNSYLVDKMVAPRRSITYFNRLYLIDNYKTQRRQWHLAPTTSHLELDELDLAILKEATKSNYTSLRTIANSIERPFSSVKSRWDKLCQAGIIVGLKVNLDPDFLKMLNYRLLIEIGGFSAGASQAIRKFALKSTASIMLVEALGRYDYELDIEVAAPQECTLVVQELLLVLEKYYPKITVLQQVKDIYYSYFPFRKS